MRVDIRHLAATAIGDEVRIEAEIMSVDAELVVCRSEDRIRTAILSAAMSLGSWIDARVSNRSGGAPAISSFRGAFRWVRSDGDHVASCLRNGVHNVLITRYDADDASVGIRNDIWFWGDAQPGSYLEAEAVISYIDRKRIVFNVFARSDVAEIARGQHERLLVSQSAFMASLAAN